MFRPLALGWAASFIVQEWRKQGYEVASQTYRVRSLPCANLEVARRGTDRALMVTDTALARIVDGPAGAVVGLAAPE